MSRQTDTRLWCLHHIGPDEVHPAPDFATAQKWADYANTAFAEHADVSRFVVAIWPWSATGHAEGLAQSIADWTLPEQPEQDNGWMPIETAPRDGTMLDLWIDEGRHTNAYWGRPSHTCGEAGRYCDCCPSYDAWVCADLNHYLTGDEGYADDPTHWMPLPPPPAPLHGGEGARA